MPVALPRAAMNVVDLQIIRPDRKRRAGGDEIERVLHDGLEARFVERSEFSRTPEGLQRVVTGMLLVPALDLSTGETVDVQGGDVARFSDYRGITQERSVATVRPVHVLSRLDHLIVEVE